MASEKAPGPRSKSPPTTFSKTWLTFSPSPAANSICEHLGLKTVGGFCGIGSEAGDDGVVLDFSEDVYSFAVVVCLDSLLVCNGGVVQL